MFILKNCVFIFNFTDKNAVISRFCKNIIEFSEFEDIISLVTMTLGSDPIIISTLTRKFYFRPNEVRGLHYIITKNKEKMKQNLQNLRTALSDEQKPKKKKKSWFSSLSSRKRLLGSEKNEYQIKPKGVDAKRIPKNKNIKLADYSVDSKKPSTTAASSKTLSERKVSVASSTKSARTSIPENEQRPRWRN